MARLVVFRGDARDSKSLDQLPVRIGRAPQNDIVLEDPAKSVSRVHAEIRLEGGRIHARRSEERQRYLGCRVSSVSRRAQAECRSQLSARSASSSKPTKWPPPVPTPGRRSALIRVCRLRELSDLLPPHRLSGGREAGRPGPNGRPGSRRDLRAAAIIAAVIFLQPSPPPAEPSQELIRPDRGGEGRRSSKARVQKRSRSTSIRLWRASPAIRIFWP